MTSEHEKYVSIKYLVVEELDVPELKDLINHGESFHQPEAGGDE